MVADVTRMGEWSPVCTACWWDEGDGPHVGAKFTGRNERPERTWETRSEVVTADRGREFAWVVAEPPTRARWGYSFVAVDGGTEVTETWELPPEGSAFFERCSVTMRRRRLAFAATQRKTVLGRRWMPSRVRPKPEPHACPTFSVRCSYGLSSPNSS